jgi:hypothetical protein
MQKNFRSVVEPALGHISPEWASLQALELGGKAGAAVIAVDFVRDDEGAAAAAPLVPEWVSRKKLAQIPWHVQESREWPSFNTDIGAEGFASTEALGVHVVVHVKLPRATRFATVEDFREMDVAEFAPFAGPSGLAPRVQTLQSDVPPPKHVNVHAWLPRAVLDEWRAPDRASVAHAGFARERLLPSLRRCLAPDGCQEKFTFFQEKWHSCPLCQLVWACPDHGSAALKLHSASCQRTKIDQKWLAETAHAFNQNMRGFRSTLGE